MNLNEILNELPELAVDENICVALSGGLDSTTLVHVLVQKYGIKKVKALAFDFGQRHRIELDMASKTAEKLGIEFDIIKLGYLSEIARETSALIDGSELRPKTAEENAGDPQVNTYVPFRNLQFAAITAAYAETHNCRYIAQGLNQVDEYGYWDTSTAFREAVNNVLSLNRQNQIEFIAPFIELYKDEELKIAKEISKILGYDILENTWSCYNGDDGSGKECGHCNTCEEKLTGYIQAGYTTEEITNKFNLTKEEVNNKKGLM